MKNWSASTVLLPTCYISDNPLTASCDFDSSKMRQWDSKELKTAAAPTSDLNLTQTLRRVRRDTLSDSSMRVFHNSPRDKMFASSRSMIHGTNTQRLLLFQEQKKKRHLEEEQQVQHILMCQHKQSRKATFPPRQLWLRGVAGRCQWFSQNNVTRRGIPVRPRKRGGRGGSPNRAGQLTSLKPALAPSRGSFSRSPPLPCCVCVGRGRNVMWPANCRLPNSSLAGRQWLGGALRLPSPSKGQ